MTMENNIERTDDFEEMIRKGREFAESVFSNSNEPLVEEGHEFDYMRFHDGHSVDELEIIKE
jgi:hypothetical protein